MDVYTKSLIAKPKKKFRQITKNFNDAEFLCHCDDPNCTGKIPLINEHFVRRLQRLRDLVGQPVIIISGVRCLRHNIAVGGSENSYHLPYNRCAADIATRKSLRTKCAKDIWLIGESLGFSGMGYLNGVVHVDIGDRYSRWVSMDKGKYLYLF